jgi:hypothetical protein
LKETALRLANSWHTIATPLHQPLTYWAQNSASSALSVRFGEHNIRIAAVGNQAALKMWIKLFCRENGLVANALTLERRTAILFFSIPGD